MSTSRAAEHSERLFIRRVLQFTANAHRACPHCRAPGQYLKDESWKATYPAIFDPLLEGQSVGPVCPCCGGDRPVEIVTRRKRKEWWIIRLPGWMSTLTQYIDQQRTRLHDVISGI